MRNLSLCLLTGLLLIGTCVGAHAQFFTTDAASETPQVDGASEPQPAPMPDLKEKPPTTWYDYPEVELRALDKVTAKATTFKMKVGETVRFNEIYIKAQTCRKPPAIEKDESAAFLQVWEQPKDAEESQWVFSGWMFASSPALSPMDHPIYDVWNLGCIGPDPEPAPVADEEEGEMSVDSPSEETPTEDSAAPTETEAAPQQDIQEEADKLLESLTSETPSAAETEESPED